MSITANSDIRAEGYANAALIAAAPELLTALKRLRDASIADPDELIDAQDMARAAIAKAMAAPAVAVGD